MSAKRGAFGRRRGLAQDILAVNLSRAVQLCVDIAAHIIAESNVAAPSTMAESFDVLAQIGAIDSAAAVKMKKSVGFRNVAVHQYQAIDWRIVHSICSKNIDDFRDFASA